MQIMDGWWLRQKVERFFAREAGRAFLRHEPLALTLPPNAGMADVEAIIRAFERRGLPAPYGDFLHGQRKLVFWDESGFPCPAPQA